MRLLVSRETKTSFVVAYDDGSFRVAVLVRGHVISRQYFGPECPKTADDALYLATRGLRAVNGNGWQSGDWTADDWARCLISVPLEAQGTITPLCAACNATRNRSGVATNVVGGCVRCGEVGQSFLIATEGN